LVLTLVLLIGSVAAFTWTERLKLEAGPISKPHFDRRFSPTCGCRNAIGEFSFRLGKPQRLQPSIVDAEGRHVASLQSVTRETAGRVALHWNGRNDAGRLVPDGIYRLRVHLDGDRRTVLIPATITVDTVPPKVRIVSPEGPIALDRSAESAIPIAYRVNERAAVLLLVDGKRAARETVRRAGRSTLEWDGTVRGEALSRGSHTLSLMAVDRAGNRGEPTPPLTVEVS
jgi:flagellar hook assembly protein FlgD